MLIQRLAIIGVGLIGGSLARALKQVKECGEVVGCGRNVRNLEKSIELGVIDRYTIHIAEAVRDADMVAVAVPLGAIAPAFQAMRDTLAADAVVTDVGSAKGSVAADARLCLGEHLPWFVPGHPIAGQEKSGVEASSPDLFKKHRVILTPLAETNPAAFSKVAAMWTHTGAEVLDMPVSHHDEVLAATSHLPHMLAYSLVDMLAQMDTRNEVFRFAAGGFRDFTRIAASDPKMWHDICLANRDALLKVLMEFNTSLQQLTEAIHAKDSKTIEKVFRRAKAARDKYSG